MSVGKNPNIKIPNDENYVSLFRVKSIENYQFYSQNLNIMDYFFIKKHGLHLIVK